MSDENTDAKLMKSAGQYAEPRTRMGSPITCNALVMDFLARHWTSALTLGVVRAASPRRITKVTRNANKYAATRWAWSAPSTRRVDNDQHLLLIALDHVPRDAADVQIMEAFVVPVAVVRSRSIVVRYRTRADDRVGSYLDQYRVTLPDTLRPSSSDAASPAAA